MFYDRMALLLNAWNALLLGILYLAFQAFPLIFAKHGFTEEQEGMTFLGIGVGMLSAIACMPLWNRWVLSSSAFCYSLSPSFSCPLSSFSFPAAL